MVDRNQFKALPGDEIIVFSKSLDRHIRARVKEISEEKLHVSNNSGYNTWLKHSNYGKTWILAEEADA